MCYVGGDEVNTACWESTPAVASWLQARNMSGDDGYAYFVKKVAGFAIAQGHRPVQVKQRLEAFPAISSPAPFPIIVMPIPKWVPKWVLVNIHDAIYQTLARLHLLLSPDTPNVRNRPVVGSLRPLQEHFTEKSDYPHLEVRDQRDGAPGRRVQRDRQRRLR